MAYCIYNMLNMFRALLCSPSGALDYMCVITAYGVQCLVAGCRRSGAEQQAVSPGRGMLHDEVVQQLGFFSTHMQRYTNKHTSPLNVLG